MNIIRNDLFIETQPVTNFAPESFEFSSDAIQSTTFLLLGKLKKATILVGETLKPIKLTKEDLERCFYGFFGRLDQFHGIYPGHKLGFDAYEPQITKGIASFIDPSKYGKKGEDRLRAFILAIIECSSKNEALITSLKSGEAYSFTVMAEKLGSISKRPIDLFIGWNLIGSVSYEYGLFIEAKFKHKVTPGQLSAYRKDSMKVIANNKNSALCLLTLSGKPYPKNLDWQPVKWLTLMSRWERNLNDVDTDFTQFKRFIWKKIGS